MRVADGREYDKRVGAVSTGAQANSIVFTPRTEVDLGRTSMGDPVEAHHLTARDATSDNHYHRGAVAKTLSSPKLEQHGKWMGAGENGL